MAMAQGSSAALLHGAWFWIISAAVVRHWPGMLQLARARQPDCQLAQPSASLAHFQLARQVEPAACSSCWQPFRIPGTYDIGMRAREPARGGNAP